MKFFKPTREYVAYLHEKDQKVIDSQNSIGIVLRLHGFIYFLPVDGVDKRDYDEQGCIRKSTPVIMRMYTQTNEILGKCMFSNMFPIPYNEVKYFNLNELSNAEVKLYQKKLEYLTTNKKRIQKAAERLYKQKVNQYQLNYLNNTVNFLDAQKASMEWELKTYGKHLNRFPDSKFFLTNPFTSGSTEYYLMNKETKVARILVQNKTQVVDTIVEVYHKEYAPLECFDGSMLKANQISEWFKGRGIPTWRDGLDDMLDNLGIKDKDSLLSKAFGLSLSDQYWMNPVDQTMEWKDVNFFDNDFNSQDFLEATFENKIKKEEEVDFFTPNNTSDGMLKKAWIVENGKRYLLKGAYKQKHQEPFNEVLASRICDVISLHHVPYEISQIKHILVSKCECFIDADSELLSAYAVLRYHNIDYREHSLTKILEEYINILKHHNLENVESSIAKMFLLDYLTLNKDRHLGNFGVIRNVETLKWSGIAPNFDSGQSMCSQESIEAMNFSNGYGRFFGLENIPFEEMLSIVCKYIDFEVDFSALYSVGDEWKVLLQQYQYESGMSDERIEILYQGFQTRIVSLKQKLTNSK